MASFSIVAAVRELGRRRTFDWRRVGWPLIEGIAGIAEIVQAVELRRIIRNEWLLVLSGIASVIFGILLFLFPGAGALEVVWLIGIYAIIFGILFIALSLRLYSARSHRESMMPAI